MVSIYYSIKMESNILNNFPNSESCSFSKRKGLLLTGLICFFLFIGYLVVNSSFSYPENVASEFKEGKK